MKLRNLFLGGTVSLLLPIGAAIALMPSEPTPNRANIDLGSAIAQQQPGQRNQQQTGSVPLPPWARDINLSTEQQQRLVKVHQQARQDCEALVKQLMAADEQMRSLLASDTSSEQLRKQHQQIQKLRQQLDTKRFETMLSEREVLTSEQRAQLGKTMQQRSGRPGEQGRQREQGM